MIGNYVFDRDCQYGRQLIIRGSVTYKHLLTIPMIKMFTYVPAGTQSTRTYNRTKLSVILLEFINPSFRAILAVG